jgi:hypothetical protein
VLADPQLVISNRIGMDARRDVLLIHLMIIPALVMQGLHEHT